jgi:hypothetical protein
MEWKRVLKDGYPEIGKRVLTYSSIYEKDDVNAYRIIDSQFIRLCLDVTHWTYLEPPTKELS